MAAAAAKKKQHVYVRVKDDGSLVCADEFSASEMRRRKIRRGDLLRAAFSKPRNYGHWRKAHQLGTLIAQNIDDFAEFQLENGRVDSHGALKKLQRMSGIECQDTEMILPNIGKLLVREPLSLAFDEMEQTRFDAAYGGFCQYLINTWWRGLNQQQVEDMASLVGLSS